MKRIFLLTLIPGYGILLPEVIKRHAFPKPEKDQSPVAGEELATLRRHIKQLEKDEEIYRYRIVGRMISDFAYVYRLEDDDQMV